MMSLKDAFSLLSPFRPAETAIRRSCNKTPLAKRLKSNDPNLVPTVLSLHTFALAQSVDNLDPGEHSVLSDIVRDHITARFVEGEEREITVCNAIHMANDQELPEAVLIYFYVLVYPFIFI